MRHKDVNWNFHDTATSWEEINAAIAMDIRDELKELNALLRCRNFLEMPHTLRGIRRNTAKRRKVRKARER